MRIIKFRAKDENGKWVYGSIFINYYDRVWDSIVSADIEGFDIYNIGERRWTSVLVNYDTIGQFTGVCDSKGNHIYEGDILSIIRGHITFTAIVKWNEKEASFGLIINGSDEINKTPLGSWLLFGQCEIIGNIYDNEQ